MYIGLNEDSVHVYHGNKLAVDLGTHLSPINVTPPPTAWEGPIGASGSGRTFNGRIQHYQDPSLEGPTEQVRGVSIAISFFFSWLLTIRCEKVIELEMIIDASKDQYNQLSKVCCWGGGGCR